MKMSSGDAPSSARRRRSSSYSSLSPMALSKMLGLVVTPTTARSSISHCRPSPRTSERLMSSYQTLWPYSASLKSGFLLII